MHPKTSEQLAVRKQMEQALQGIINARLAVLPTTDHPVHEGQRLAAAVSNRAIQ